ncbi:hypothetical protein CMI46_01270 [Candidatus Pacearchaeota archaeon]|nr:hypothetical protein [Candidatus Pacearchaeota archaeon]|tara:strand:+ start:21365 stop:23185 length:1821 start_codon:yes stop_codon:yes gene_type:complete
MEKKSFVDRIINKTLSLKKETYFVILLLILGFILRSVNALGRKFSGDEMVHGTHAIGFINSGKLQIMDQSAVWFWLTDLFLKLFGANLFGIRFTSVLFGTLLIAVTYLLGKEIFNKKVGIFAAILTTISAYQVSFMEAGMDTTMTFFAMFSIYFFVKFIKTNKNFFFYLSWIVMGIAVMTKPIALLFLVGLGFASLYYSNKKNGKIEFRKHIYVLLIILLLFTPVLTFNYLLYKDKGIADLQFSRFFKISPETYQSISSTIESFSLSTLLVDYGGGEPGILRSVSFMYNYEVLLILIFAIIGLIYLFKNKNNFTFLLLSTFLFPFVFLSGTSLLPNHFVFASVYVTLFAAYGLVKVLSFLKEEKNRKMFIYGFFTLFLITTFFAMSEFNNGFLYGGKNELGNLIDFKDENIDDNSLVILDGRIYRGRSVFMFWDKQYVEANLFLDILNNNEQIPGDSVLFKTYYVECLIDDCGWGTIDEQPEFNQSMESLTQSFKEASTVEKTVQDAHGNEIFRVYKSQISLNQGVIPIIQSSHNWFFYPVNYQPQKDIFDNYQIHNYFDRLLDKIAHLILYIEIILALLLGISVFYFLEKTQDEKRENLHNNAVV